MRLSNGQERGDAEPALVVDVEHAGERGHEPGDRERGERGARRVDAVRARRVLVLADRDQRAAGAAVPDAARRDVHQREAGEAEVVVAGLGADVDEPEEVGALDPAESGSQLSKNSWLSRYDDVSSANASVMTGSVNPPRRIAGYPTITAMTAPTSPPTSSAIADVQPLVRGERAADRRADADERHLPEAHLPGPAGEHHERDPDDAEDDDRPRRG